jgi:hypothetical protein
MCFELQEDAEAAVEAYQAAWEVVSDHPQERGAMLSFWIEECLYRGTLARLKLKYSIYKLICEQINN